MKHKDYLDISLAPDKQTFESRLIGFANRLDFGIISGALVIEKAGHPDVYLTMGNTPEAFIKSQRDIGNTMRDPVLKSLKHLSIPITYDQKTYVDAGVADLWDNQAQFGFHTGISMALHLPDGKHFLLGVDRAEALPKKDVSLMRMMADLQLLAVHAQGAAARLFFSDVGGPERPRLTASEIAVLKWTMNGKSAKTIGEIMGISMHTVVFHLRNACRKLDVSTKLQAVFKAVNLGLI